MKTVPMAFLVEWCQQDLVRFQGFEEMAQARRRAGNRMAKRGGEAIRIAICSMNWFRSALRQGVEHLGEIAADRTPAP